MYIETSRNQEPSYFSATVAELILLNQYVTEDKTSQSNIYSYLWYLLGMLGISGAMSAYVGISVGSCRATDRLLITRLAFS